MYFSDIPPKTSVVQFVYLMDKISIRYTLAVFQGYQIYHSIYSFNRLLCKVWLQYLSWLTTNLPTCFNVTSEFIYIHRVFDNIFSELFELVGHVTI